MPAKPNSPEPKRRRLLGSGTAGTSWEVISSPNVEDPEPPKLRLESVLSKLKFANVGAYPGKVSVPVPEMSRNSLLFSETTIGPVMVNVAPPVFVLTMSPSGVAKV